MMREQPHQGQVAGTRWNPAQYLKFTDHRLRPAMELLAGVSLATPGVIYDLGCGSGHITRLMAQRWPDATVTGVDNSGEMIAKAGAEPSSVHWQQADISTWSPPQAVDLIYSNATLQWLADHDRLFPRLLQMLAPGGCLAVQMPLSWGMPSHLLMRETLADGGPGGSGLGSAELRQAMGRKWVEDAPVYYDLLVGGGASLDIWETEYLQVLPVGAEGTHPVVEWVKGTGLRPILHSLDDPARARFLAEYARRVAAHYPIRPDGHVLYPFRRLFIVATLP